MENESEVFDDEFNDLFASIKTPSQEQDSAKKRKVDDQFEDDSFNDLILQIPSQTFAVQSVSKPGPESNSTSVVKSAASSSLFRPTMLEPKQSKKRESVPSSKMQKLDSFFKKDNKVASTSKTVSSNSKKYTPSKSAAKQKLLLPEKRLWVYEEGANFDYIEKFNAKARKNGHNIEMTPEFSRRLTHYIADRLSDGSVMKNAKYYAAIGVGIWILHHAWIQAITTSQQIANEEDFEVANYDKELCASSKLSRQLKLKILEGIHIKKIIEIPLFNFRFRVDHLFDVLKTNGAKITMTTLDALRNELKVSQLTDDEKKLNGKRMFFIASNIGTHMEICQNCFVTLGCLTVDPDYFIRLLDNYSTNHAPVKENECFIPKVLIKAKNEELVQFAS